MTHADWTFLKVIGLGAVALVAVWLIMQAATEIWERWRWRR